MQDVQTGLTKKVKRKKRKKRKEEKKRKDKDSPVALRARGKEQRILVRIDSTNIKELVTGYEMQAANLHGQILEEGRQLALLLGKNFPVAGDLWPHVNRFHRVIDKNKLNDIWVTMLIPDKRGVSDLAFVFFLSCSLSLNLYCSRFYCMLS
jgi:hypothetical protein